MRTEAEIAEMQYWDERKAKEPTLRDKLAMAALQGLLSHGGQSYDVQHWDRDDFAREAYLHADEMIRVRRLTNPDE